MKTFEEAVSAVLCREVTAQDDGSDIEDASAKYHDTLREIQTHPTTAIVVQGFLQEIELRGIPFHIMMGVIFSHGVMVGMEMERQDSICPTSDKTKENQNEPSA